MSHEAQQYHSQQFEHIIATIFTCRSVIKYNLTLSDEQKLEFLGDIDIALETLRAKLITEPHPVVLPPTLRPQDQDQLSSSLKEDDMVHAVGADQQALQALYRVYHAYMDENKSTNIAAFVARFNDVMETINDVQQFIQAQGVRYDGYGSKHEQATDPLHSMKVFIADIYYIFMEFLRVLSDALQLNNVHLDTEKLRSLQGEHIPALTQTGEAQSIQANELMRLMRAFETQQQIERMRGRLSSRVSEGSAFLEFIKEGISSVSVQKREEIVGQLGKLSLLLTDMSRLLTEYEQAASHMFHR